jgi:hypothetical protein
LRFFVCLKVIIACHNDNKKSGLCPMSFMYAGNICKSQIREKCKREQNCKHCVTPWRWLNVAIKSRLCDKLMNWNGLKGWNEIERTKRRENFYQRQLNFVLTNARCIFLSKQTKKKNSATCLLIKTFRAKSMKTLNKQIWKWAFKD